MTDRRYSNAEVSHLMANRRTALSIAAKAVADAFGPLNPSATTETWARVTTETADLLLPWLNAPLDEVAAE